MMKKFAFVVAFVFAAAGYAAVGTAQEAVRTETGGPGKAAAPQAEVGTTAGSTDTAGDKAQGTGDAAVTAGAGEAAGRTATSGAAQTAATGAGSAKTAAGRFRITVTVPNVRNDKGTLLISLFGQADGFPGDAAKAFARKSVPIGNGRATVAFDGVPAGTWAIGILHDENGNLKMDRYGIGIPKEGVGASNNRKILAGPPKFKGASFEVKSDVTKEITLKYF